MCRRLVLLALLPIAPACLFAAERSANQGNQPPAQSYRTPQAVTFSVTAEEEVYRFDPPNNGAGPMWCFGSTCLVRIGKDVFASGQETLKGVPRLNNTRWTLWKRGCDAWELQHADPAGRTREPCPLVAFTDGRVFLSGNPTLVTDVSRPSGPARPEILQFNAANPKAPFRRLLPEWEGDPPFTEHSYRTFAADGTAGELILLQNIGYTHAEWCFLDKGGSWKAKGRLVWPWGAEYAKPQPIRVCYPTVMLRNRAVHFCGISDISEPNPKWAESKKQAGRKVGYDFRRLFYTWTPDITREKFRDWVEIASRDQTAGRIMPCDLWLGPDGLVHLLWTEQAIDILLRKQFFPEAKQRYELGYGRVRDGKLLTRRTLLAAEEGVSGEMPDWGRFNVTPDGRLFVFCFVGGRDAKRQPLAENRLLELADDGSPARSCRVPLKCPLSRFFTATVRGGSPPSNTLDLLGVPTSGEPAVRYVQIALPPFSPSGR